MAKVAVGIPLYGYVPAFVYWRHLGWVVTCTVQTREMTGLLGSESCYLPAGRNRIVKDALEGGFTHLFFLDQDVIVPPGTINKLLAHKKPVVGALYYQKIAPHAPNAGSQNPDGTWQPLSNRQRNVELQRVDVIGMGATLIDLDVCRKLGEDGWFNMNGETGEDIMFCERVRKAGFSLWVDTTIDAYHVGATPVDRSYFRVDEVEPRGTNL